MADVLKLLVIEVLFGCDMDRGKLDRLINYLKTIMLGHESDEAQGLLRDMEAMAIECFAHIDLVFRTYKQGNQIVEPECSIKRTEVRPLKLVWDIYNYNKRDKMLKIIEELCNIRYGSGVEGEEIVVGFNDDVETLLDQLTQTSVKQVQVVSITGMAGLGKTTLARKLYRDPLIEYYFDVRAWTCVSQTYVKRDLLLGILSSFIYDLTEEICNMSEVQLGEKLYRFLKGRKYLVVFDDIWDCMAWTDLKIYFPDNKVGSRVLVPYYHNKYDTWNVDTHSSI